MDRGRVISLVVDANVRCLGGIGIRHFTLSTRLRLDRRHRASRTGVSTRLGAGRSSKSLRYRISLRFAGRKARGSITLRGRATDRSGRRGACSNGRARSFGLRRASTADGPAAAARDGSLYGTVGRRRPNKLADSIVVRVTRRGRQVSALAGVSLDCGRHPDDFLLNGTAVTPVRADGTFGRAERFNTPFADTVVAYTVEVAGRFTAAGVVGTIRARSVARRGGRVTARCDSGVVSFSAVR